MPSGGRRLEEKVEVAWTYRCLKSGTTALEPNNSEHFLVINNCNNKRNPDVKLLLLSLCSDCAQLVH